MGWEVISTWNDDNYSGPYKIWTVTNGRMYFITTVEETGEEDSKWLCALLNGQETEEDFIQNRFGYCFYYIKDDYAAIYNLFIWPKYRLKGHARKILQQVIREIKESGYDGSIGIETIPGDTSIDKERLRLFYEGLGLLVLNKENKNE